jgi:hypothetical protein
MAKRNPETWLERWNVVLAVDDVVWLDRLGAEIAAATSAKVSRSEIIRAAVATLKELHRCASRYPERLMPLAQCKSGTQLVVEVILAIRRAATTQ